VTIIQLIQLDKLCLKYVFIIHLLKNIFYYFIMYNTVFKVKYYDIEKELIDKLNVKNPETNSDEEYDYSNQDVLDICNKLYRDELLSVFGAEDLSDDKLDKGMSYVYEIMMINVRFKEIINEMETTLINGFIKNDDIIPDKQESLRQLILISLFSQHLFHIMHKCICQQIELGMVDNDLLVELKTHSFEFVKTHFGVN